MVIATNFPSKKAWDSGSDNILEDFYKPALMHAKRYRRLTGFFSGKIGRYYHVLL